MIDVKIKSSAIETSSSEIRIAKIAKEVYLLEFRLLLGNHSLQFPFSLFLSQSFSNYNLLVCMEWSASYEGLIMHLLRQGRERERGKYRLAQPSRLNKSEALGGRERDKERLSNEGNCLT